MQEAEDKELKDDIKIPKLSFKTSYSFGYDEIKFAEMDQNIQVRYNATTVKSGLASIYCVLWEKIYEINHLRDNYADLISLIFHINRGDLKFVPDTNDTSKWS